MRYPLSSIVRKDIEFVVDGCIKKLIRERFENHTGNEKEVWKDLENNPLLFNGIPVRSVRCFTGLKPEASAPIDRGSVKLGNNHHIAIYIDSEGKRHESCVTFWHAVERKKAGIPIIITSPNEVWDNLPDGLSEEFIHQLPQPNWNFEVSLQQNEMFVLGLEPEAFEEAFNSRDYAWLSKYLYRVQQIATKNYRFRHHLETSVDDKYAGVKNEMLSKKIGKVKVIQSFDAFQSQNPQKVRISLLGEITKA